MSENTTTTEQAAEYAAETHAAIVALEAVAKADAKRADAIAKVEERNAATIIAKSLAFAPAFDTVARLLGDASDTKTLEHLIAHTDHKLPSQGQVSRYLAVGRYVPRGEEDATWKRYANATWTGADGVTYTNAATFNDLSVWVRLALATETQEPRTHKARTIVDDVHMTHAEYAKRSHVKSESEQAAEQAATEQAAEISEVTEQAAEQAADGVPNVDAAVRLAFIGCDDDVIAEAAAAYDLGEMDDADLSSLALAALATLRLRRNAKVAAAAS